MSLLFSRRSEQRSLSFQDVWGSGGPANAIGGGLLNGGLRLAPVYAATSLIADLLSTAPVSVFTEDADGNRKLATPQPDLVLRPSPFTRGRVVWTHQCLASLLLRGNAYGYVVAIDRRGVPSRIVWFHPDDVTVIEEQADWFHWPTYYWRGRRLDNSLVVHVSGYTLPGSVIGLSPLGLFKTIVETGTFAQDKARDWFKNNNVPAGKLRNTARRLKPDEADVVKSRLKATMRTGEPFVTGADWDWTTLAVPADQAKFLESLKMTATQVAAIYRVSPEDVGGETGGSLTYKTLEQDNTKLTVRTLGVWAARLDEALTEIDPYPNEYVRHNLDRLSQGDKTSRLLAHAVGLQAGIETLPEARADEDKAPLTQDEIDFWIEHYRKTSGALEVAPPMPKVGAGPSGGANA
jgi:HK97 family phage portal protein